MSEVRVATKKIEAVALAALLRHGALAENAGPVARALSLAEAEGNRVCGLFYLPHFCAQLAVGKIDGTARPVVTAKGAVIRVDAATGFAQPAFAAGLPDLIAAARRLGVGVMSLANSTNALALGHFVRPLAEAGLIGLALSNAPASVAPPGATARLFGTNPLAWAAPRAGDLPIVVDQSLSAVTKTEVILRQASGRALQPGWAQDAAGNPTTDAGAALAGALLPMGGQKGANLVLLVELLTAALSGSHLSLMASPLGTPEGGPSRLGQFVMALDPAGFDPGFADRITSLAEAMDVAGARLPGAGYHCADEVGVDAGLWKECQSLAGESSSIQK